MAKQIVGGFGKPLFYICGEEQSPYVDFMESIPSDVISIGCVVEKELVSDNLLGDYALKITAQQSNAMVAFKFASGGFGEFLEKQVFYSLLLKGSGAVKAKIAQYHDGTGQSTSEVTYNLTSTKPVQEGLSDTLTNFLGATTLYLVFKLPTGGSSFYIYFNSIRFVQTQILFDEEQEFNLSFEKVIKSQVKLASGVIKEYIKGWRPEIEFKYEAMTATDESNRVLLSEANNLVVYPRNDAKFHIFAVWNGNYSRAYIDGLMVGHSGSLRYSSIYLFDFKPNQIVTE